jgi:ABC-type amino acid transport system permease subunit
LAVTVTKDSSIVSTIAVADLMLQTQNIVSANLRGLEVYLTTATVYVVLTIPLIALGQILERRFSYTTRVGVLIRARSRLALSWSGLVRVLGFRA